MGDRSYGTRSRRAAGAIAGLVATGAGLAAAELAVGAVDGASSPVVAVGQKVIDLVPLPLKNWAVDTFGTSDKTVLVVTTLVILFVAGIAVGIVAASGRRIAAARGHGRDRAPRHRCRGDPTRSDRRQGGADRRRHGGLDGGAVVADAASGRDDAPAVAPNDAVATVAATDELLPVESPTVVFPGIGAADRRVFLMRSIGVASLAAIAGGAGRLLQRRYDVGGERATLALPSVAADVPAAILPPNADVDVEGLSSFVTPNADFYRIDTALVVPQLSKDEWRLRIHGMVERELELTFDDLLARDQIEAYVTLACVSNPVGGPYVGNALWQGVRLAELLAEVGVDPAATQALSTSVDGWTCGTPVSSLTDGRNAMLAIAMNGEPLPAEHGYPVRMVVPGEYGYVSATKWVVDMEFTTWEDVEAYWVPRGWSQQAPMKTMTRVEVPHPRTTVPVGPLQIAGTAFAVHRGISAVEVRVDGGEWVRAELAGVPSPDTWRKWVVRVGDRRRRAHDRGPGHRRSRSGADRRGRRRRPQRRLRLRRRALRRRLTDAQFAQSVYGVEKRA